MEMARLQVAMMSVLRTRETTSEIEHLQCDLHAAITSKDIYFYFAIVTVYVVNVPFLMIQ